MGAIRTLLAFALYVYVPFPSTPLHMHTAHTKAPTMHTGSAVPAQTPAWVPKSLPATSKISLININYFFLQ